jgi:hypothetical protein
LENFRRVYATMIKEWLGYDDTQVVLKGSRRLGASRLRRIGRNPPKADAVFLCGFREFCVDRRGERSIVLSRTGGLEAPQTLPSQSLAPDGPPVA